MSEIKGYDKIVGAMSKLSLARDIKIEKKVVIDRAEQKIEVAIKVTPKKAPLAVLVVPPVRTASKNAAELLLYQIELEKKADKTAQQKTDRDNRTNRRSGEKEQMEYFLKKAKPTNSNT